MEAAAENAPFEILVPQRTLGNDLRAIKIVWQRDIIRFWGDKPRIFASLGQPFLYMFVMGTGLSTMVPPQGGLWLPTFLFPGVLVFSVLFTCFLSAGSLVTDREFGFMRVMLVAPVRRGAIVLGKCLGGATVGTLQGSLIIAIGGIVRVPYDPVLIVTLLGELGLISFALTALGVFVAVHIRRMQSYLAIMQLSASPMYFFSGALFRVDHLPRWLATMNRLDPLSYAVDPMRRAVFGRLDIGIGGLTWGAFHVPVIVELGLIATLALIAVALATVQFQKAD